MRLLAYRTTVSVRLAYGILLLLIAASIARAQNVPTLVLATADTPPFVTDNGRGLYQQVIAEAARRVGVQVEIRRLPSNRSLNHAATGLVDGEFGRTALIPSQYASLIIVPEPLARFDFVAFVTRDVGGIAEWADLSTLRVAYIRGWVLVENALNAHEAVTVLDSEDQLFQVLRAGRVDVAIYNGLRGRAWIERNQGSGVYALSPPLDDQPVHLFFHRSRAGYVEPFSNALSEMRADGTYRHIYDSVVNVR